MQFLFDAWSQLESQLKANGVMLLLDYDGTLTPIVSHPGLSRFPAASQKLLQKLSQLDDVKVAVITGRSLKEIKKLIGLPELIYIGNHGLELQGPKIQFIHPEAKRTRKILQHVRGRLQKALGSFRGVRVEDKNLTLSIHYRQLEEDQEESAKTVLIKVLKPYLKSSKVVITEGKKVWEIRPPAAWHKGTAVLWLLARSMVRRSEKVMPVYFGDDQTDEDAFRLLKGKGIMVRVTSAPEEPTEAGYYVRSPREVAEFLTRLQKLKTAPKANCAAVATSVA